MTTGVVKVMGVVRGKTVELAHEPGLPEGQAVSVVLRPALPPGEGLRRAFGSWAEGAGSLDEFINQVYVDRDEDRPDAMP